MKKYYCILIFSYLLLSSSVWENNKDIKIEWVDNLQGDYSFFNEWAYADYVYKNEFGQLVCDVICHPDTEMMKKEKGKIYKDSLHRYYQLVDTTHIYHSIDCEANMYGWAGTDRISIKRTDTGLIEAHTYCEGGTYSGLRLTIKNDSCVPIVEFISPVGFSQTKHFECKKGYIKIDQNFWDENIMKAEFYFYFSDTENPEKDLWWKGKIYTQINEERN